MKVRVVFLSYPNDTPPRDYWDMGMIESIIAHDMWRPAKAFNYEAIEAKSLENVDSQDGLVVVFPARAQVDYADRLNEELKRFPWIVLMLTGDEEAVFPFQKITHPKMRLWVMSPRMNIEYPEGTRFIGTGFPPAARQHLPTFSREADSREKDLFFAGQITHSRRQAMAEALTAALERDDMTGEFIATPGFTQGVTPAEYYAKLADTKVAPCPSGPETPDSFRIFEALEAGCVPIADCDTPRLEFGPHYWHFFFDEEPPFPILTNYTQLVGYTLDILSDYPRRANKVFAWWLKIKRQMTYNLQEDVWSLAKPEGTVPFANAACDHITVIVPTSPIAAHPSTAMIEKTVMDIRAHLPHAEIIITVDGIRSQQEHYREAYEQYTQRLLWMAHHEWTNVLVVVHDEHKHQAIMAREVLEFVKTPLILYVEHDAPITPDRDIEWDKLVRAILHGEANVIRLHHEALVLPDHMHLMIGDRVEVEGAKMWRTKQWSQRPHLANTLFYHHMLDTYFHPDSHTMIEDVMHGVVANGCDDTHSLGWYMFRLWLYTPDGDIKRSYHLDGRGEDDKFEMDIKPLERTD